MKQSLKISQKLIDLQKKTAWDILNAFLKLPSEIEYDDVKYILEYHKNEEVHCLQWVNPITNDVFCAYTAPDILGLLIKVYDFLSHFYNE